MHFFKFLGKIFPVAFLKWLYYFDDLFISNVKVKYASYPAPETPTHNNKPWRQIHQLPLF